MYGAPDVWDALLRKIAGIAAAYLRVQVEAGASAVQLFDSWAGALDARRLPPLTCMPHSARVLAAVGGLGVPRIHFGVGTGELLGADGRGRRRRGRCRLAYAARRRRSPLVGDRAVQGNLDPTLVFAPTEVMTGAGRRDHRGRPGRRGHVFNLGHGVLPVHRPRPAGPAHDHGSDAQFGARAVTLTGATLGRCRSTERPRTHVVVVGGGIAGLAAAPRPAPRPARRCSVLEGSPEIGGKLGSAEVGGRRRRRRRRGDAGPPPRGGRPGRASSAWATARAPGDGSAQLWTRGSGCGRCRRTLIGVPTGPGRRWPPAGVLSAPGLARATHETALAAPARRPGRRGRRLLGSRLGTEVVDRLVEPLLGGVYAGHASNLSAAAAVPQVVALLPGARIAAGGRGRRATGVATTRCSPVSCGGVGLLPERRRGRPRRPHRRRPCASSCATPTAAGGSSSARPATPRPSRRTRSCSRRRARRRARLLADVAPGGRARSSPRSSTPRWRSSRSRSGARRSGDCGSGFLVPAGRRAADQGCDVLLRRSGAGSRRGLGPWRDPACASIGRHREEASLQRTDEELVARVARRPRRRDRARVRPVDAHVQRWGGALPQYAVGHLDRVARIRAAVATVPGLALCGAAYDGVGIPAVHRVRPPGGGFAARGRMRAWPSHPNTRRMTRRTRLAPAS